MIKAIIFDLDNCLAAADEPGPGLLEPTFDAIRRANRGTLPWPILEQAFAECWRRPLDDVAHKYGFSDEMLAAGWAVNARAEVMGPMKGYGDLVALSGLPARLYLVTSGFRRLQASKVHALGIAPLFERVEIDAIDEPDRKGKERIFTQILNGQGLQPEEVLVVGDSAEAEIATGNRLGIRTVQILRPGVIRAEAATYHIQSLNELPAVLSGAGPGR